jgi:hypothetical protein
MSNFGGVKVQDGSGNLISSTSGALNVQVANPQTSVSITGTPTVTVGNSSIAVTGAFYQATQPVSGTVAVSGVSGSVAVTGTFWQSVQPVSLSSLPALATGSNVIGSVKVTDGTNFQPTGDSSARSIHTTIDNSSIAVTGSFYQATQPVSGTVAVSSVSGSVAVTGTFWQSTQPVSIASMPTTPVKPDGSVWTLTSTSANVNVTNSSLPVTGTFWQSTQPVSIASAVTVAQSTAANLNATVVGTGTFAVQATQSGTWNIGSITTLPAVSIAAAQTIAVTQATASNLNCTATLAANQTITTVPATSGGWSTVVNQAVTNSAATVKSSAGQLGGYIIFNPSAATAWVFFYNNSSPTIGSTTNLIAQVGVPAGGGAHIEFGQGMAFSAGIYMAASAAATSSSAPATALQVTAMYK